MNQNENQKINKEDEMGTSATLKDFILTKSAVIVVSLYFPNLEAIFNSSTSINEIIYRFYLFYNPNQLWYPDWQPTSGHAI